MWDPKRGQSLQPSLPPRQHAPGPPHPGPSVSGPGGYPQAPPVSNFPKVSPEPLLFIRTPPPMHTQPSRVADSLVPSYPPATSGCHEGAQPAWASVPSSGEWANSCTCVGLWWREWGTFRGALPMVPGAQEHSKDLLSNHLSEPRLHPYEGRAASVKFRDGQVKPGAHNRCLMSASGHWPRPEPRAQEVDATLGVVFQGREVPKGEADMRPSFAS